MVRNCTQQLLPGQALHPKSALQVEDGEGGGNDEGCGGGGGETNAVSIPGCGVVTRK